MPPLLAQTMIHLPMLPQRTPIPPKRAQLRWTRDPLSRPARLVVVSLPDVTVVIPTRNRRALLTQTLGTVLEQTDVCLEVVIVDDASHDETARLLARSGEPSVRVVRHRVPQGVSAARNAGLELARGRWIAFTDDDDLWAPRKLAAQLEALDGQDRSAWCQVGEVMVRHDLSIVAAKIPDDDSSDIYRELLQSNIVPGGASGVLVDTALAREVGGFDTRLATLADWDFWIRLAAALPVATVRRPLVAYRTHSGGMSCDVDLILRETRMVEEKYRRERATLGVGSGDGVDTEYQLYLGDQYLRGGRRWAAARHHLKLAYVERRLRWAAFAGADIVGMPLQDWRDRRRVARIPTWWVEEAETWLGPLRETQAVAPAAAT